MKMTYRRRNTTFTSWVWQRLFEIRGTLVVELIQEFFSTFNFDYTHTELRRANTITFQLGGRPRSMTMEQFIVALGLHTSAEVRKSSFKKYFEEGERICPSKSSFVEYWSTISNQPLIGASPSYTTIRDPITRLIHRLISYSIRGRREGQEKVNTVNLFYLHSMDDGPIVNIPWCVAEYLRSGANGTKRTSTICGGQFVAKLADHFQLFMGGQLNACTEVNPPMGIMGKEALVGLGIITRNAIGGIRWVNPMAPTNAEHEEEVEEEAPESSQRTRSHGARIEALERRVQHLRYEVGR